ncbi:MAG: RluA family pseudouridine synthase [Flavobacteriales bacterium]|nr:RluA family pseudouridine synthase [Flavobacteriales bacterium]
MAVEIHVVSKLNSPIRIQEYGVGIFEYVPTKSALKKALKKQFITVNDELANTATFILGGESIKLSIPENEAQKRKLIFPLKVIYEDEHLAVIHKPAGILVSGNSFKTIAKALPQNIKRSNLSDATRPQPVHRLDYATTGILLIGKTKSSIRSLNKLFEDKLIKKTYFAITIGTIKSSGQIALDVDDKPAVTKYSTINSVQSKRFDQLNLLELLPQTGRRHQLRKHLSSIGNSILGDKDYGMEGLILNGKGMYLHAYSLNFIHPFTKDAVSFIDDLPERFQKIFPED